MPKDNFGKEIAKAIIKETKKLIEKFQPEIDAEGGSVDVGTEKGGKVVLTFNHISKELEDKINQYIAQRNRKSGHK